LRDSSAPASSGPPKSLVVGANPILSALLTERGAASRVFWRIPAIEFSSTAHTISEVRKYLPTLAKAIARSEELLDMSLRLLPLVIHDRRAYRARLEDAQRRIGKRDPNDVDLPALALHLRAPIWSNDRDFSVARVPWFTTAQLLAQLEAGGGGEM
jgi:predicted nucleic acid-binding protein